MQLFSKNYDAYIASINQGIPSISFFSELLIHKQYAKVSQLFDFFHDAMDQYKPLYYASLQLSGDNDIGLLKMPPELAESVDDIINYIREKQAFYYDIG